MKSFVLFFFLFFVSFVAKANFMVYPISKDIKEGGSEVIRVYSKSKDVQYIKVYAKKVMNPGTKEEYEADTSNWEGGLVVTPNRVILPGGSSKSVRLSQLKTPNVEEVYRVYFESVKPEKQEIASESKSLKTDLSINIIYAALVRVLPKDNKVNVNISYSPENNILINNAGNVRFGIKDILFCKSSTINNDCVKKSYNKNVYPGGSFDTLFSKNDFLHVFIATDKNDVNREKGMIQIRIP